MKADVRATLELCIETAIQDAMKFVQGRPNNVFDLVDAEYITECILERVDNCFFSTFSPEDND